MGLFDSIFGSSRPERKNPTITQKRHVAVKQGRKCARCGRRESEDCRLQYHHARSVANGGATTTRNLRALCPNCHDLMSRRQATKRAERRREDNDMMNAFDPFYKPKSTDVRVRRKGTTKKKRKSSRRNDDSMASWFNF